MQQVDPFIPVSKPLQTPKRQPLAGLVNNIPRERPSRHLHAHVASVDGLIRPSRSLRRTSITRSPRIIREHTTDGYQGSLTSPASRQPVGHVQTRQHGIRPKKIVRSHSLLKKLQTPVIIFTVVIAGLLLQSALVGMVFIAVYAVTVFTQRLESRISFGLAFCSLLAVVLLVLFKNGSPLITNFSLYAFMLLVIGAITLGREVQSTRP